MNEQEPRAVEGDDLPEGARQIIGQKAGIMLRFTHPDGTTRKGTYEEAFRECQPLVDAALSDPEQALQVMEALEVEDAEASDESGSSFSSPQNE